jgi:hypothetical protein
MQNSNAGHKEIVMSGSVGVRCKRRIDNTTQIATTIIRRGKANRGNFSSHPFLHFPSTNMSFSPLPSGRVISTSLYEADYFRQGPKRTINDGTIHLCISIPPSRPTHTLPFIPAFWFGLKAYKQFP